MKTAISIPDRVFDEAEQAAKRLGMSRRELYATAVNEYLKKHRTQDVTKKLDEVYEKEPSALHAVLSGMQSASLETKDW